MEVYTLYPPACKFLKLKQHISIHHMRKALYRKNYSQYIKDRTENFYADYFPCNKSKCKLKACYKLVSAIC
jgi:hypothetical protein